MAQADQILTANRLRDGEVVYWSGRQWVTALSEAQVFQDDPAAKAALKAADASVQDRTVVNPYLFDVRREAGALRPVKEREIIRAAGPTVRLDLGKQSHRGLRCIDMTNSMRGSWRSASRNSATRSSGAFPAS